MKNVTCEGCGAKAQVQHPETGGDPEQDGWLYDDRETEFIGETVAPDGTVIQVPTTYREKTAKVILWLCNDPSHGEEGYLNRVEEPV